MNRYKAFPVASLFRFGPPALCLTARKALAIVINDMVNQLIEYINEKRNIAKHIWLYRKKSILFPDDHEIWSREFGNIVTKIINDKAANKEIINVQVTFNKHEEHLNIDSFRIEYL